MYQVARLFVFVTFTVYCCDAFCTLCINGFCAISLQQPLGYCQCFPGYSGPYCGHRDSVCDAHPCGQGTCTLSSHSVNYYTCTCQLGYHGDRCQYDSCHDEPCGSHGTCTVTTHYPYYSCSCSSGYSGTNCQSNTCDLKPCGQHGSCSMTSRIPYYTCHCAAGYFGNRCQSDGCLSHPCGTHGTCRINSYPPYYYACLCQVGYSGRLCQYQNGWSQWSSLPQCSVTCGTGLRFRQRTCIGPSSGCVGYSTDIVRCDMGRCSGCQRLNNPHEGSVICTGSNVGATAIYSCQRGFILIGSSKRYCLDTNTWSGSDPNCSLGCPSLRNPPNGIVAHTGLISGSIAIYTCRAGYTLAGSSQRHCLNTSSWSGLEPTCSLECKQLNQPRHGFINPHNTTLGSVANYFCISGYTLQGSSSRTCLTDGTWSGNVVTCHII